MNAPLPAPFLDRVHRRARLTLLAWSAAAVLTAAALTGAARLGWFPRGELWALAPALLAAASLIAWLFRARRLTRAGYARALDVRWATRSRLETAVELSAADSALARAQRTEATGQLAERQHVGLAPWLAALTLVVAALLFLGIEGTAFTVRALRRPPAAKVTATPPAPPEARASIEWKTPAREIKATAIEEVPLTALADSATGFHALSLEILVNGEASVSRALDAAALGESARPGAHELSPSLFLDETGAKPYDIVSYHLTGELNGTPARTVTSPLQFIQIRPPQKDTGQKGTASADAAKMLSLLGSLKAAQLRFIDANFTLARLADAKNETAWQTENDRTALEQKALAQKAAEARDFALSKHAPPLIAKNLGEARSLMLDAAKAIAATDNDSAVKPQGRALALITECEKLFGQALEITGPPPPALPMEDPFHDDQVFKLPPRAETPAGELEKLAARQRDLSQQLGSSPGQAPGSGSGDAEKNLARDAEQLAASGKLDPSVQALTRDAAAAAAATARQLDAHDPTAAREPAAAALAALEKAVEAQDHAGLEIAVAELDRVRRSLNAATRDESAGTRGATLLAARDDLRAAATQQQLTGSAEAARQLSAVAESLGAAKLPGSDSKPNSTARASESATAAARAQISLAPRGAGLARAIRQLKRSPASSNGAGISPGTAADLESASQEAEWLTGDASTIALARKVGAQMSALQQKTPPDRAAARTSLDDVARLALALESAQNTGARDEIVRRFNVDEIDPAYRPAVENYFERLSREGAKPPPAQP